MTTRFLLTLTSLLLLIVAGISCSKSSLIEGVDTPYKYQNYSGNKGWLQVYIRKGGPAEKCNEMKIYEGVHYLEKIGKDYIFDDTYKVVCGDKKALQITMPPGTYTIKASGACGGLTVTRTIRAFICTTLEIK